MIWVTVTDPSAFIDMKTWMLGPASSLTHSAGVVVVLQSLSLRSDTDHWSGSGSYLGLGLGLLLLIRALVPMMKTMNARTMAA